MACAVLAISIFNPFLSARADFGGFWIPEYYPEFYSDWPGVMWSFRQSFVILPMNWSGTVSYVEVSLGQYWLQFWGTGITGWTGYTLMLIFVLQVSTIVSGFLAILKNNPTSIILSPVFNLLMVILASLVYWSMEESFWREKELLFGFWLFITSTIMFFIAVVVHYCTRVLQKRGIWSGEVSKEVEL
jgi:hypothetical protein